MDERERKQLNVLHERDLDLLLERFGIKDIFLANQIKCKFCNRLVNKENVYSFLPESGMVNVICDAPECILQLSQYIEEKKKGIIEE